MSDIINNLLLIIIFLFLGFFWGASIAIDTYNIEEIQDIKQTDNGYYITINDEIYYKEVEKDE